SLIILIIGLITARLPVVVRATPPRFLNLGDTCNLQIVVQNLTEKDLTIKYACHSLTHSLSVFVSCSSNLIETHHLFYCFLMGLLAGQIHGEIQKY
ncbi:MAG: hypothetical protein ACHQIH_04910, partial [Ignavibacteria bacterium]